MIVLTQTLIKYQEPLRPEELAFLVNREAKERSIYFRIFRILMVVSFVLPYIAAWYRAFDDAPLAFSYPRFFISAGILLFISAFSTYCTYLFFLRRIQQDIRLQTKTIEISRITQKLYIERNNTYHFYLDSPSKLSIDVSERDFDRLREGDEVSIEFTTHAREYLGYF